MFKSLLSAVNTNGSSLILDIFVILAVVIAGAFICYFLGEIFVDAIRKSSDKTKSNSSELRFDDKNGENEKPILSAFSIDGKDVEKEEIAEETKEDVPYFDAVDKNDSLEKTEEKNESVFEENFEEVDDNKAEQEKVEAEEYISDEERRNEERRNYLEARRQELLRRMQEDTEEEESDLSEIRNEEESETETEEVSEDAELVFKNELEDEPEEVASESDEEESAEETDENVEEETADVDDLEEERKALALEKERYEMMVRELESAKKALAESQAQITVEQPVENNSIGLSLAELKDKLANAEERLKETEKEFKQCKKEYIPLHKVWSTHEKDEKKLRRKEALVAKQKVLLYGVNNYADIDEEKAKKLAEDLDLLDGLKLSVQHCEEVMKNNEERYPLLEKMYNVLKLRDEELKSDIEKYKAEIEKLEAEQNANDGSEE